MERSSVFGRQDHYLSNGADHSLMSPSIAYARARCVEERFVAPKEKESNPIAAKLRADGSVCFRVLGASMFPWIRSGDLVFVRRFAYEQASRGDVVLFERADRLFVHRVIRAAVAGAGGGERGALITKGDALDAEDEPVTRAEFLGLVLRVHRGDRHIDMGSIGRVMLGRLIARFSSASFALYGPVRFLKHLVFG
jgi:signal peptidase I